jgi:L-rhamnose mutarotase
MRQEQRMKRYGSVIKVKPEMLDAYKHLHANTWPGVLQRISESNIRNYSIFYRDGYLFSYFEYAGEDYAGDMAKMAEDPVTQAWWKLTDPCQQAVESAAEGEWWAPMEEVFHHD